MCIMICENNKKNIVTDNRVISGRHYIFFCIYVFIIHILTLHLFAKSLETSENGMLFLYDFRIEKYVFCVLETLCFLYALFKHFKKRSFLDICFIFLLLLYFVPGAVQQAATNSAWDYMIFFFFFWVLMEIWGTILRKKEKESIISYVPVLHVDKWFIYFTIGSIISAIGLLALFHKSLSYGYLVLVLSDVYEVRADATSSNIHWVFSNIEYWAAYFSVIGTAYFASKKKWLLVAVLVLVNLSLFILEAYRMFIFLEIIALFIGLLKIDTNKLPSIFFVFSILFWVELTLYEEGLVFNDVFRRFSVVPNRISEFYYDYFKTHEPDYLRVAYSRFSSLLGYPSPYEKESIGHIISNYYIGVDGGMNNGLVGGGVFAFGAASLFITTFGYTFVYNIFGRYIKKINNNSITIITAFFMVSLSANLPYFLANLFSLSYLLLLFLTFLIICKHKKNRIQ